MREIKFRMWYEEERIMIDGDSLAFEEYEPICQLLTQDNIMQYTGVKDLNGKEIYEGDIIERVTDTVVWKFIGIVEFQLDGSIGWCVQTNNGRWGLNSHDAYKVIGNIHENPDLTK